MIGMRIEVADGERNGGGSTDENCDQESILGWTSGTNKLEACFDPEMKLRLKIGDGGGVGRYMEGGAMVSKYDGDVLCVLLNFFDLLSGPTRQARTQQTLFCKISVDMPSPEGGVGTECRDGLAALKVRKGTPTLFFFFSK